MRRAAGVSQLNRRSRDNVIESAGARDGHAKELILGRRGKGRMNSGRMKSGWWGNGWMKSGWRSNGHIKTC